VGGGWGNAATNWHDTVGGGLGNSASGGKATIGGGHNNVASGALATICGGYSNTVSGWDSIIAGGWGNTASGYRTAIGGGAENLVTATYGTIAGGYNNSVRADRGTIAGGHNNSVRADRGTIGGGFSNTAGGLDSTVGGGWINAAGGENAAVGGGMFNTADGLDATVGGGVSNEASANRATVGGGYDNTASSNAATVPGGASNVASGAYSFAAGAVAQATHPGSFVWSSAESTASWGDNTFTARAHGGVRFYSAAGTSTGVQLAAGGSSWSSISDRNVKENYAAVDAGRLLEALAALPILTWNLETQSPEMRHVGPVAQDFNGMFGYLFGEVESPVHINTMDAVGVALAAGQGLYDLSQQQAARITELETENASLRQQMDDLGARVAALEKGGGAVPTQPGPAGLLAGVGLLLVGSTAVLFLRSGVSWPSRRLPQGGAR
jgi:hypothetical protein